MTTLLIVMYGIAVLSILLGFVALLKQRVYLDKETMAPVEIEIPKIGKFKSNYPALVFVLLGAGMAYMAFVRSQGKESWSITGTFENPTQNNVSWERGMVEVHPTEVEDIRFYNNRNFEIKLLLEEGKTFEEAVESIQFTFDSASFTLRPSEHAQDANGNALLVGKSEHEREYKIKPVYFNN